MIFQNYFTERRPIPKTWSLLRSNISPIPYRTVLILIEIFFMLSHADPHSPTDSIAALPTMKVKNQKNTSDNFTTVPPTAHFKAPVIEETPGVLRDVTRYIGLHPSTISSLSHHFDNTFYVRGGYSSETLFLIDGIEFENINHFSSSTGTGGPLSFIDPLMVKDVSFQTSTTPVH